MEYDYKDTKIIGYRERSRQCFHELLDGGHAVGVRRRLRRVRSRRRHRVTRHLVPERLQRQAVILG